MCFRKSPYKVYWAAKTMEDLFIPSDNDNNRCSFFEKLSDTYVLGPMKTIKKLVDCIETRLGEGDGDGDGDGDGGGGGGGGGDVDVDVKQEEKDEEDGEEEEEEERDTIKNMKPPFLIKNSEGKYYFILKKKTTKVNSVYSNNPKYLVGASAETSGFNFKVHHNSTL